MRAELGPSGFADADVLRFADGSADAAEAAARLRAFLARFEAALKARERIRWDNPTVYLLGRDDELRPLLVLDLAEHGAGLTDEEFDATVFALALFLCENCLLAFFNEKFAVLVRVGRKPLRPVLRQRCERFFSCLAEHFPLLWDRVYADGACPGSPLPPAPPASGISPDCLEAKFGGRATARAERFPPGPAAALPLDAQVAAEKGLRGLSFFGRPNQLLPREMLLRLAEHDDAGRRKTLRRMSSPRPKSLSSFTRGPTQCVSKLEDSGVFLQRMLQFERNLKVFDADATGLSSPSRTLSNSGGPANSESPRTSATAPVACLPSVSESAEGTFSALSTSIFKGTKTAASTAHNWSISAVDITLRATPQPSAPRELSFSSISGIIGSSGSHCTLEEDALPPYAYPPRVYHPAYQRNHFRSHKAGGFAQGSSPPRGRPPGKGHSWAFLPFCCERAD